MLLKRRQPACAAEECSCRTLCLIHDKWHVCLPACLADSMMALGVCSLLLGIHRGNLSCKMMQIVLLGQAIRGPEKCFKSALPCADSI